MKATPCCTETTIPSCSPDRWSTVNPELIAKNGDLTCFGGFWHIFYRKPRFFHGFSQQYWWFHNTMQFWTKKSDDSNQSVSISGHQQSINEMGLKGGFPNSFGFNQQKICELWGYFQKNARPLVNGNWGKQPSSGDAKQKTTVLTCHFLIFLWLYVYVLEGLVSMIFQASIAFHMFHLKFRGLLQWKKPRTNEQTAWRRVRTNIDAEIHMQRNELMRPMRPFQNHIKISTHVLHSTLELMMGYTLRYGY